MTFKHCKDLPLALNLRILDKPKNINTKLTSVGSFATAYMAELDKPIIVRRSSGCNIRL